MRLSDGASAARAVLSDKPEAAVGVGLGDFLHCQWHAHVHCPKPRTRALWMPNFEVV